MNHSHDHDHHDHDHDHRDHGHGHGHDHGHGHVHAPASFGRAFAIGITLNTGFVLIEAFYGWRAGSLALLADAAHNLSDVGGLLLAWAGLAASRIRADDRHTYGWRRGSIIASFANALILLVAMGSLAWEAVQRLHAPAPIDAGTVMTVAAIGVLVNGVTAMLFMAGSKGDLNIRGAFLHMAADALVSAGVVIGGALYLWQGWDWIDPLLSLVIAFVILTGTWSLFRQSLHLLFDGVPEHIDLAEVRQCLQSLPGVERVHDLHVWALASSETALSSHLVLAGDEHDTDALLMLANEALQERFGIRHSTLQVETGRYAKMCAIAKDACSARS